MFSIRRWNGSAGKQGVGRLSKKLKTSNWHSWHDTPFDARDIRINFSFWLWINSWCWIIFTKGDNFPFSLANLLTLFRSSFMNLVNPKMPNERASEHSLHELLYKISEEQSCAIRLYTLLAARLFLSSKIEYHLPINKRTIQQFQFNHVTFYTRRDRFWWDEVIWLFFF